MGRRTRTPLSFAVALGLLLATPPQAPAAAQSELVISKQGSKLYHRPGCPAIADGKGVVALSRAQAESRGYKPHADCDPANAPSGSSATKAEPPPTVYVDGTQYYHRKTCKKLDGDAKNVKEVALEVAGKSYWPCPTCKPPIRRRNTEPAIPGTERRAP